MRLRGGKCPTDQYVAAISSLTLGSGLLDVASTLLDCDLVAALINAGPHFTVLPSSDGLVSTVIDGDTSGTDYSRQAAFFDLHTDGLYYAAVPEFVLLYCISPGKHRVPTVFVDTRLVIERMERLGLLDEMREIEMVYRGRDGGEHARPLVEEHPATGELVVNLGARVYFRSMRGSHLSGRETTSVVHQMFEQADASAIVHQWDAQQAILFDNARYVHGRGLNADSMLTDGDRQLKRIWLSRVQALR